MFGLVKQCTTPGCNAVSRAKGKCWRCYRLAKKALAKLNKRQKPQAEEE